MDNTQTCLNTISSTPGKCLISGGYLILNPNKKGLVLALDANFEVSSKAIPLSQSLFCSSLSSLASFESSIKISVTSHFLKETYVYLISINDSLIDITQINKEANYNKWIENSIKASFYSFFCLNDHLDKQHITSMLFSTMIDISIHSDYRFYSYSMSNERKDIKTGLGSSSALISSLCLNIIAILFKLTNTTSNQVKVLAEAKNVRTANIHIQAMIAYASILANNLSQNKIGSGFDIMTCLFGSQVFQQCTLSLPNHSLNTENVFVLSKDTIDETKNYIEKFKETYISKLHLLSKKSPSVLKSVMISIEYGSDTRIMVKNVLAWAKEKMNKELFDDESFAKLDRVNEKIITCITTAFFTSNANETNNDDDTDIVASFKDTGNSLKELCVEYRTILKEISNKTNVEIEPSVLSSLLDALIKRENVIYAICPGAGGYDSIIVLGIEQEKNGEVFIKEVENSIRLFNKQHNDTDNKNIKGIKAHLIKVSITDIDNGTVLYN